MSTTFNGNSGTEIYDLDTTHFTYTYYLSFKKDGSYSLDFSQTHEGDTTDYYKYQGQWSFIQKNKSGDLKNKESILLSDMSGIFTSGGTTSSGSVSVPIYGELFILDQLENERLVMKFRSDRISAYSGSTSTGFVESELTFIPK